jgi:hypothetical protein
MAGGGAVAGAAMFSRSATAATDLSTSITDGVMGRVESTSAESLALRTDHDVVRISAAPDARIYAGGEGLVPDLAAFVPGDRVVAQGRRVSGGGFVASSVGSVLQPIDVTARRVDGSGTLADTALGRVRVAGRLPDAPAGARRAPVRAGDRLSGMAWRDPRTGEQLLLAQSGSTQA